MGWENLLPGHLDPLPPEDTSTLVLPACFFAAALDLGEREKGGSVDQGAKGEEAHRRVVPQCIGIHGDIRGGDHHGGCGQHGVLGATIAMIQSACP